MDCDLCRDDEAKKEDRRAMEALLRAVPLEMVSTFGLKAEAKDT
jgi:hypothetical protein